MHRYEIEPSELAQRTGEHGSAYRTAMAIADLEAQRGRNAASKLAEAVRYLEPTLVPVAAGVWMYNLMTVLVQ